MGYLNGKRVRFHRVIMDVLDNPDAFVDHENNDGTDNRKSNLRVCSVIENNFNRKPKSKYKGVEKHGGYWRVRIQKHNELFVFGKYNTPEEAALAYNEKAIELFGEFAYLNEIKEKEVI